MTAPKNASPLPMPSAGVAATLSNVATAVRRGPNLAVLSPAADADIRQKMASASVTARNPQASAVDLNEPDTDGSTIRLKFSDVGFNPYQPRQYVNESYEAIRTSMKANGMDVALQVTRKGPGHPYFLAGGGNSRLGIAQDIWRDDSDPRFEYGFFIFKRWPGDRRLMASALSENLARSDLKFWEVAKAACEIIDNLELEHGPLSERRLEELLPVEGIHAKRALIGRWTFTRKRLGTLGHALIELTGQQVLSKYQPRLNALCRLAAKFSIEVEDYWSLFVTPCLTQAGEDFYRDPRTYEVDRICDAIEVRFAEHVGESAASIKRMLQIMTAAEGNVTLADLKAPPPVVEAPAAKATRSFGDAGSSHQEAPEGRTNTTAGAAPQEDGSNTVPQNALRSLRTTTPAPAAASHTADGAPDTAIQGASDHAQSNAGTWSMGSPVLAAPGSANLLLPNDSEDVRGRLDAELRYLVQRVGVAECFVPCATLPFGYFMEYPAPGALLAPTGTQTTADILDRVQASAVFWTLQKLSGQLDPERAQHLPPTSRFYQSLVSDDYSLASLTATIVGDGPIDDVLLLATRPGCTAMTQLLQVVVLMRCVSERYPAMA